ncbi:hypothetical protein [Sphingomonas sp. NPDC079357]|uniref:hypothetical protein n=1 Tax=Sphingomonas sp. NPDC079357 TaxID=3364518 RepID=UPI003850F26F
MADDMVAIFGEGQRGVDEELLRADRHIGAPQGKRPPSRLLTITLLSVAGFAAAIGSGVVIGKNTVGAAIVGPSALPKTAAARPAPMPASRFEGRTLKSTALPPEAISNAMVASAGPSDVPASAIAVTKRLKQAKSTSAPQRLESLDSRGNGERADVLFRRTPHVIQDQPASPPAAIAARSRADCYDDTDCTNVRLSAADGDVARAYAEATRSGVRVRDLRDYRGEWIRARNVAAYRPREALRIYDMVAADLRTLADAAVADDRTPWQ